MPRFRNMGGRETPRGFPCVVCERLGPNLADTLTARMAPPRGQPIRYHEGKESVGWSGVGFDVEHGMPPPGRQACACM